MLDLTEAIRKLWGECRNPLWIAQKLGLVDSFTGEPDVELVQEIIENPANYRLKEAQ